MTLTTALQLRAARTVAGLTRGELATLAEIAPETIKRLEGMGGELAGRAATVRALQTALEAYGVTFLDDDGRGPGLRFAPAVDKPFLKTKGEPDE